MRESVCEHGVVSVIFYIEPFERKVFDKENFRDAFEFPGYLSYDWNYVEGSVDAENKGDGVLGYFLETRVLPELAEQVFYIAEVVKVTHLSWSLFI